ncbi:MAG: histidinol-phosphate transaminase [Gammaproteobacteria bacterium]|nr:MAG: histidinol-phosphate transaminase [Gammaproteobacteria bacterium]
MSSRTDIETVLQQITQPGVAALKPYQPGKPEDEVQRELGLERIVKLASNESPIGPSPKAVAAAAEAARGVHRYPDGSGFRLKQALCNTLNVRPEQLTLGNGSNDVLMLIAQAFAGAETEIMFSRYAFAVYPIATQAVNATPVIVPDLNYGHDLRAMLGAITERTRIIFVANPNNPTGTWLRHAELLAFLEQVPENVLVVLDEAYAEYVEEPDYPNGVHWLPDFPNLIVTRTFSKAYGLAGLRVGYSVSHPAIADRLNRVRQPFNVNSAALAAAEAALADTDHLAEAVAVNRRGKRQLEEAFKALRIPYIPSAGNFITFELPGEAAPYNEALLRRGAIVRPLAPYQMPNHLRVTIGTEAENLFFLEALKAVLDAG